MAWVAIATAGAGLVGGYLNNRAGKENAQVAQGMSEEDRKFNERMYHQSLQDSRVNQTNDFGSTGWTQDKDGRWTQTGKLADPERARLDDFRQIAANRMRAAGNVQFAEGPMNFEAAGLGRIANNAGFGNGTSGARGEMPHGNMGMWGGQQHAPGTAGGASLAPGMQTPRYGSQATNAPVTTPPIESSITPEAPVTAPEIPPAQASQIADLVRQIQELQDKQAQQAASVPDWYAGQGGN